MRPTISRSVLSACAAAALLAAVSPASALDQNIIVNVNGTAQNVGTLTTAVNNRVEEGLFQLGGSFKYLMDDAKGQQFRYFQMVVHDPDPINYLGNPLTAPYTDPPSNGWDYQRTPANNFATGAPGADQSPFYENDDDNVNTYKFPKYSGTLVNFGGQGAFPVHSAANGYSLTQDVPGYGTAALTNSTLDFYTFIVYLDPTLKAASQFDVLAGYQWGVGRDGTGAYYDIQPTALDLSTDDLQGKVSLALGEDGFSDWTAQYRFSIPEPTNAVPVSAFAALGIVRRRR